VIGRPFADLGEVGIDELGASFGPRTPEGEPREQEDLPARIALDERRAAHERVLVTSRDGVEREVSVTGMPLFAHADEFVGAMVFFWRE
jgi:hypothetical protein